MRKARGSKNLNHADRLEKRKAILAALVKATEDDASLPGGADEFNDESNGYYTLTTEEMEALINGDVGKIENWVSRLDKRHATWLLRWLIKESW